MGEQTQQAGDPSFSDSSSTRVARVRCNQGMTSGLDQPRYGGRRKAPNVGDTYANEGARVGACEFERRTGAASLQMVRWPINPQTNGRISS